MTMPEPTAEEGAVPPARAEAAPRAVALEQVTIGYNVIEGLIAVTFGIIAGSIALTGFGFDSWIEVTAAVVVLRRLRAEIAGGEPDEEKERRALRVVAVTFFVLAVYVTVEGIRDLAPTVHDNSAAASRELRHPA